MNDVSACGLTFRHIYRRPDGNDPNGSCLFAARSPTDTVGSQNFRTSSRRQIAFSGGAADAGNVAPTFCFSVPAMSKLTTLTVESL